MLSLSGYMASLSEGTIAYTRLEHLRTKRADKS